MLEGTIERQGFLDIIQLLTMGRKSGRLDISGNVDGTLFFLEGDLLDCQMSNLSGDEAFIELFILVEGNFRFQDERISVKRHISKSLTDLLMDASRQAAEWDEATKEFPFEDAALVLAQFVPKAEDTFTFNGFEWTILARINGRRSFPEIARQLNLPKTRAGIALAKLKKRGLITIEDEESALLRTVFRKTADLLYHLIRTRTKPRLRERLFTEFNRWAFSKGFDIRMLEDGGIGNNIPYDMLIDEKRAIYRQILEQIHEAAQTELNRNELEDHMTELYERFNETERRVVAEAGLNKFLSSRKGKKGEGPDFWETTGSVGPEGIVPR